MTIQKITPKELQKKLTEDSKLEILDVRADEKFQEFHIEGSKNIPKTVIFGLEETGEPLSLPKENEFIVTCTTGNSAAKCANILDGLGYKVRVLEGGLTAWKEYKKHCEIKPE
ncbi:rhodanese-like domain-containing protein [Neobacillus ginsengisoli]|uniref:Rhodanese-related sulfurtransferase n=1 Tax=Neobacillus ginsengisoli TaxID=904295 RepID=A0ABT9XY61_9BACI|nr:rhodanese-like domain-containing protein [Neobacillus ginsengisoli]MDQ0200500.1 rhodanese-related sulfurtransferase [Neobacillus ginsengisoli]